MAEEKLRLQTQIKGLVYIRDALSFYMTNVRIRNNKYQISIIVLSLGTAFVETVSGEFGWAFSTRSSLRRMAVILPIALTTFIGFISSMMKFERLSDKLEEVTKSIERCHYSINRHREALALTELSDELKQENQLCFREAILSAEMVWLARMDPQTKRKYLKKSNLLHDVFSEENSDEEVLKTLKESFGNKTPVKIMDFFKSTPAAPGGSQV